MVSLAQQAQIRKQVEEQKLAGLSNERIRQNIQAQYGGAQSQKNLSSQANKAVSGDMSQTSGSTSKPVSVSAPRQTTQTMQPTQQQAPASTPEVDFKFGGDARAAGFTQEDFDRRNTDFIKQFQLDNQFTTREEALKGVTDAAKRVISDRELRGATADEFAQTIKGITDQVKLRGDQATAPSAVSAMVEGEAPDPKNNLTTMMWDEIAKLDEANQKNVLNAVQDFTLAQGSFQREKDKFTNFQDIDSRNKGVINAIVERRIAKQQAGQQIGDTPSQDEIMFAMEQTGQDEDTVRRIIQGEGYEDLEYTDEARGELSKKTDRGLEDLEIQRQRKMEDLDRQLEEVRYSYNNQIADVQRQVERNVQASEKSGALQGTNRSSAFVQGIQNIKNDGDRLIGRLETALRRAESATVENKARLMQDFNTQVSRAKEDLDTQLTSIANSFGMQALDAANSLDGEELGKQLDLLKEQLDLDKLNVYNSYVQAVSNTQNVVAKDLDNIEQFEQYKRTKTQPIVDALEANDGAGLGSLSAPEIVGMAQQGIITPEQAQGYILAQQGKTIATLRQLGQLTTADIQMVSQRLQEGSTPNEIISELQETGRFAPTEQVAEETVFAGEQPGGGVVEQTAVKSGTNSYSSIPALGLQVGQAAPAGTWFASIGDGVVTQIGGDAAFLESIGADPNLDKLSGIDISGNVGDPVTSPFSGEVTKAITTSDGNNLVEVKTDDGVTLQFNHLQDLTDPTTGQGIVAGQRIEANTPFASMGSTGVGTGAHLDIAGFTGDRTGPRMSMPDLANYISTGQLPQWELLKESQLERTRRGNMTNTEMAKVEEDALKGGWIDEFIDAQKQGLKVTLTPTQQKQFNSERDDFRGNPVVKGFEEGLSQFENLSSALSAQSGPGDMAGVFAFMKTLDPTSVVRESEFDSAANSAGVGARATNIFNRLSSGKVLTEEQSKDFKLIAEQFIRNKAKSYDRLYNDMANVFDSFGIDGSLLPAKASDQMIEFLKGEDEDVQEVQQQTLGEQISAAEAVASQVDNPFLQAPTQIDTNTGGLTEEQLQRIAEMF